MHHPQWAMKPDGLMIVCNSSKQSSDHPIIGQQKEVHPPYLNDGNSTFYFSWRPCEWCCLSMNMCQIVTEVHGLYADCLQGLWSTKYPQKWPLIHQEFLPSILLWRHSICYLMFHGLQVCSFNNQLFEKWFQHSCCSLLWIQTIWWCLFNLTLYMNMEYPSSWLSIRHDCATTRPSLPKNH